MRWISLGDARRKPIQAQASVGRPYHRNTQRRLLLVAAAAAAIAVVVAVVAHRGRAECVTLLVPSYFAPGRLWRAAVAGVAPPKLLIADPSNGPGTAKDPAYAAAITGARRAKDAHALGLSVGMKNGIEIVDSDLVSAFDWALNEQCFQHNECGALTKFVAAGKAVFQVEYRGDPTSFRPTANSLGFSTMKNGSPLARGDSRAEAIGHASVVLSP